MVAALISLAAVFAVAGMPAQSSAAVGRQVTAASRHSDPVYLGYLFYLKGPQVWQAWPPYPQPPKLPSDAAAKAASQRLTAWECKGYDRQVESGVYIRKCLKSWAGLCFPLHHWAVGCSAFFAVADAANVKIAGYQATIYWQQVAGRTAEVEPFAYFNNIGDSCGPQCEASPDGG